MMGLEVRQTEKLKSIFTTVRYWFYKPLWNWHDSKLGISLRHSIRSENALLWKYPNELIDIDTTVIWIFLQNTIK